MSKRRTKRPNNLHFFSKSVLIANIVIAGCLLLSYLATFLSPEILWPIAFFGLAYPFILVLNLLFVIYWLIRYPKLALISVITILAGSSFILNYIGFREGTAISVPKSSDNFFRVLSYNVHNFKPFGDKNDLYTRDQILDIIRKEKPDVICFQEFFTRRKGDYNFQKMILEIMQSEEFYFNPTTDNGYEAMGLAIFSRHPIQDQGRIQFAKKMNWNEALYADIKFGKQLIRVYNVHFQSINFQPEDYEYLKTVTKEINPKSSKKIIIRLRDAFKKRARQARILKDHMDQCQTPYIVAGDFNDTPISYTVKTISKGLKNSFREKGSGLGITYNGEFPNFQIDYIFSSEHFDVRNYLIVPKKLSDHYPVRADLELAPRP